MSLSAQAIDTHNLAHLDLTTLFCGHPGEARPTGSNSGSLPSAHTLGEERCS